MEIYHMWGRELALKIMMEFRFFLANFNEEIDLYFILFQFSTINHFFPSIQHNFLIVLQISNYWYL